MKVKKLLLEIEFAGDVGIQELRDMMKRISQETALISKIKTEIVEAEI